MGRITSREYNPARYLRPAYGLNPAFDSCLTIQSCCSARPPASGVFFKGLKELGQVKQDASTKYHRGDKSFIRKTGWGLAGLLAGAVGW